MEEQASTARKRLQEKLPDAPLCAGLEGLRGKAFIARFVANVEELGFTYTMAFTSWKPLLDGPGRGDCQTLCFAAVELYNAFHGEDAARIGRKIGTFFIRGGGAVIGGEVGNVDGQHWRFSGHYWVIIEGKNYDILFNGAKLDTSTWIDKDDDFRPHDDEQYRGYSSCERFGGTVVYRRDSSTSISDLYTLDPAHALPRMSTVTAGSEDRSADEEEFKAQLKARCCALF